MNKIQSLSILDKDYLQWIKDLSSRFRKSQIKAAVRVNQVMLQFYWELGRDIVERDAENYYGSKFYSSLSRDLKNEIQNANGLSERNLRYTKKFYLLSEDIKKILQQAVADSDEKILQQVAAKLFMLPWGHHLLLIDKFPNQPEKAWFYICEAINEGWSRNMLLNFMDTNLYERQGKALTNFKKTLPAETSDLAQELTKDPYNFAFTGITERYNEQLLKDKLLNNPTIGLLICKEKDRIQAQYALESSSQPLAISKYDLEKFYPEKVEGTIPTIEEIETKLNEGLIIKHNINE